MSNCRCSSGSNTSRDGLRVPGFFFREALRRVEWLSLLLRSQKRLEKNAHESPPGGYSETKHITF